MRATANEFAKSSSFLFRNCGGQHVDPQAAFYDPVSFPDLTPVVLAYDKRRMETDLSSIMAVYQLSMASNDWSTVRSDEPPTVGIHNWTILANDESSMVGFDYPVPWIYLESSLYNLRTTFLADYLPMGAIDHPFSSMDDAMPAPDHALVDDTTNRNRRNWETIVDDTLPRQTFGSDSCTHEEPNDKASIHQHQG